MDELKKYLQEHRDELDVESPDESVWIHIRQQAYRRRLRTRIKVVAISASVAATLLIVVMVGIKIDTKQAIAPPQVEVKPRDSVRQTVAVSSATNTDGNSESNESIGMEKKASVNSTGSRQNAALVRLLEKNYTKMVNLQLHTIRSTPILLEEANYFNDFKVQLQQMDKDEAALRKDIQTTGINNILLGQLINLYQQKMSLLKDLLTEMNKVNNQVKQRNIDCDTLKASYIKI